MAGGLKCEQSLIAPLRSARIALDDPPTSSSLADEKHVCSLLLSTAARDPEVYCSACPPAAMRDWGPCEASSWPAAPGPDCIR